MSEGTKVEVTLPPGISAKAFQALLDRAPKPVSSGKAFILFHEWGDETKGRIYRDEYKSKEYFNIRRWYTDEEGFLKPGKGFVFHPEELEDLILGLQKCQEWLDGKEPEDTTEQSDI